MTMLGFEAKFPEFPVPCRNEWTVVTRKPQCQRGSLELYFGFKFVLPICCKCLVTACVRDWTCSFS